MSSEYPTTAAGLLGIARRIVVDVDAGICPVARCHHDVDQHRDLGCRIDSCACTLTPARVRAERVEAAALAGVFDAAHPQACIQRAQSLIGAVIRDPGNPDNTSRLETAFTQLEISQRAPKPPPVAADRDGGAR